MNNEKTTAAISQNFDFSKVPSWYVLCTNDACPLKTDCLRHLAGQHATDSLEIATCVMPRTLKNGQCRWFDKTTTEVYAAGFSHLYDQVMKKDYTTMRKTITRYLHGTRIYYEYMRGERGLTPQEQQWIKDYVKSFGYEWEVTFDRYYEDYVYHHLSLNGVE